MDVQQKKQEFQKYLEKNGVIDHITQVLVGLYEQPNRPVNPMEFVKEHFGADASANADELKGTIEKLKADVKSKDAEIAQLRVRCGAVVCAESPAPFLGCAVTD